MTNSFIIFSYSDEDFKDENHSHKLSLPQKRRLRQSESLSQGRSPQEHRQLDLFDSQAADSLLLLKRQKAQISSSPNIPPQERNRYRVTFQGRILGDRLSLDEAIQLAKRGES